MIPGACIQQHNPIFCYFAGFYQWLVSHKSLPNLFPCLTKVACKELKSQAGNMKIRKYYGVVPFEILTQEEISEMCTRFSLSSNTITWLCYTFLFISLASVYLITVRVKGYCWTLSHAVTHIFCRPPLKELSVLSWDLYLTAQNTHKRHPSPRRDSKPQFQQASGRRTML